MFYLAWRPPFNGQQYLNLFLAMATGCPQFTQKNKTKYFPGYSVHEKASF